MIVFSCGYKPTNKSKIKSILDIIKSNPKIKFISFNDINIIDESLDYIYECLRNNRYLQTIELSTNSNFLYFNKRKLLSFFLYYDNCILKYLISFLLN